ncbi:MAG: quinoprotein dehydrogenase-associated putative ABC transporter substrate-binding protein [Vulcanimicrobiaceae bacterium]
MSAGFSRRALCIGMAFAALCFGRAYAAQPLRVCADPNYMPYSNRAEAGFENKLAEVVGRALGRPVQFYWHSSRTEDEYVQYLQDTIKAGKCDVLMDVPYSMDQVKTTHPFFISSYVFVLRKAARYDLTSLDSPVLHHLKIGYEVETPVQDGLKLRALTIGAKPFLTLDEPSASPGAIVNAVEDGQINVGLTWDPAVGYFLKSHPDLTAVTIPNSRTQGSPEQYSFPMSMATRNDDPSLNAALNHVIATHGAELRAVLKAYNIKFFSPGDTNS